MYYVVCNAYIECFLLEFAHSDSIISTEYSLLESFFVHSISIALSYLH